MRDGQTWIMLCRGQGLRYQMDYILGTNRLLFQNVAARDPRHNTSHYLVLGCLRGMILR